MTILKKQELKSVLGRAIVQAVSRWLPTAAVRVKKAGSSHVGFVVDKVVLVNMKQNEGLIAF
jgi:hypothetical protein